MRNRLAIALVTVARFACSPGEEPAERRSEATIEKEIAAGTFVFKRELEDIHLNIEARLAELIGPAAGRLLSGR